MKISIKFDPHDLWVGVYWCIKWTSKVDPTRKSIWIQKRKAHVYVCVVPMIVVHIEWWMRRKQ